MVYHRKFALLDHLPFLPPHIADERLKKRSHVTAEGCRVWTGCMKGEHGMLRVPSPAGRHHHLFVHKIAWYVAHGVYPRRPTVLISSCRNARCIEAGHYRAEGLRKLTDEQVIEARELFWTPWLKFNERQRMMVPPTAEQLAAWDLGMSIVTVRRVMSGATFDVNKWQGYARTKDEVLTAVAKRRQDAADRKADYAQIWSQEALAARYDVSLAAMHYILHGVTYRSVPMPAAAQKAVQKAAQMGQSATSVAESKPVAARAWDANRQQLAAEAALVMLPSDLLGRTHYTPVKRAAPVDA